MSNNIPIRTKQIKKQNKIIKRQHDRQKSIASSDANCIRVSRRVYNNGWTYAEANKIFRIAKREHKHLRGLLHSNELRKQYLVPRTLRDFISCVYVIGANIY